MRPGVHRPGYHVPGPCSAPRPPSCVVDTARGAGALWHRAYSIEGALGIRKESVTVVADILTTLRSECCQMTLGTQYGQYAGINRPVEGNREMVRT
jgi:hypothetical protein